MRNSYAAAIAAIALLASGCPKPASTDTPIPQPDEPPQTDNPALPPAIPAKIETKEIPPMSGHDPSAKSPLIDYMVAENRRWMNKVRTLREAPAYYLAYQIHDLRGVIIEAEGGALTVDSDDRSRTLDVEARVGTPQMDSRRPLRDQRLNALTAAARLGVIPFGTDKKAIEHHLWLETDRRLREAQLRYKLVRNDAHVVTKRDRPPDFSIEKGEVFYQAKVSLKFDKASWIKRLRDCSRKAKSGRAATRGSCRLDLEENTVYFVNSEGSQTQLSWTKARIVVSVGVKADDGMPLSRTEQAFADRPDQLPDDSGVATMIKTVNDDLDGLHKAPVVDPYVGPAILEGRAAAVFFHEVFGHRVEGHRQKDDNSGQTFTSKIGEPIMPAWLTVYDDPRLSTLNGVSLNGFYRFDDEGVRAQRAMLVQDGVFTGFVLGRDPIKGFGHSNGHGRKQPGLQTVSRQGNLVVESARSVTKDELHAALIAEVKRQGKPYGMIFTDISGGFTLTERFLPQAFKVNPVMAYRLYPDGRTELVRGVDIVGTPLTALASIMSAARPVETFNGMCGAESGWVPVSASAPSLLLKQLEVERGFKPTDNSPVLAPPSIRKGDAR